MSTNNDQTPVSKDHALLKSAAQTANLRANSLNRVETQQQEDQVVGGEEDASESEDESLEEDRNVQVVEDVSFELRTRKRKRRDENEDLEALYMQQLENEEAKQRAKKDLQSSSKRSKIPATEQSNIDGSEDEEGDEDSTSQAEPVDEEGDDGPFEVPAHETMNQGTSTNLEKSNRTIFLGNVSTQAIASKSAKKALVKHLSSFLDSLPNEDAPHKVESIRFRSTAYDVKIPKKAAFARKELMDATTKSTNAYVVYTTQVAAREAVKSLNGTVILERHLRADSVSHPAKIDHRRCIFVGNLDFVDDDSQIREANEEERRGKKKQKEPADVEEGLWRQFGKVGTVESVRVVRDSKTRIGKGFAYVQFTDENAVEAALLFNDKKFPPLLPRKIRVMRAKAIKRNSASRPSSRYQTLNRGVKSIQGRARKVLGHGGAENLKKAGPNQIQSLSIKPPEAFVFEGQRASSKQGNNGLKLGSSGKRKDKARSRSSKRAAAWKATKGKTLKK